MESSEIVASGNILGVFGYPRTCWTTLMGLFCFAFSVIALSQEDGIYENYRQQALLRLERALVEIDKRPITTDTMIESSHLFFFLGDIMSPDLRNERLELFTKGERLALKVRVDEPNNKAAILWGALNALGKIRITRGLAAIRDIRNIRNEMERLQLLDETFEHGAADRVLAKIYQEAPRFISIGSKRKARHHFRRAMAIAPEFPANPLLYAEFLLDEGEVAEAKSLTLQVVTSSRMKDYPVYEYQWRRALFRISRALAENGEPLPDRIYDEITGGGE